MNRSTRLVGFLQHDLGIGTDAIAMAQRVSQQSGGPIHVVLWQLGLLSLQQLERAFDWLEGHSGL